MAGICLAVGLAIGYLIPGSPSASGTVRPAGNAVSVNASAASMGGGQKADRPAQASTAAGSAAPHGSGMGVGQMPTMAEMKQMADKQAAPLLARLKTDPNNSTVLTQIGAIYHSTHQFKEAATFYGMAVQADPKNVALRTKLASSLYRGGDVDGAIAQLNQGLTYDPKDANSLFDLGTIKLEGKQDSKGALAAWQKLLKTNPQLSEERRATVQKLIANAEATPGGEHKAEGAQQ
jgi:cytochrome c-type biogenesis protein CcmH/NrfG